MSHRIGNTVTLELEEDGKCELCGNIDELRPYGPNGEEICYDCGMKNEEVTKRQCARVLLGLNIQ